MDTKKRPHLIKYKPTTLQELLGAIAIVLAVFVAALSGVIGLIKWIYKVLRRLK